MNKVVTAIGNPTVNDMLKKEKEVDITHKDLQYKEAVLEILKQNKVDYLVISEKILEEKDFYIELKKIRKVQKEIKIIFIVEEKNYFYEKIKKDNKINIIILNKKINNNVLVKKIIKIINNNKIKSNNKILKLKKEFILIDVNSEKIINLKKELISMNTKFLIIMEANEQAIKNAQKFINIILNNLKIEKNKIFIIINNYNKNSIDILIIKQIFSGIKIIGKIKEKTGGMYGY